jgi:Fe-S-cluster containining protein
VAAWRHGGWYSAWRGVQPPVTAVHILGRANQMLRVAAATIIALLWHCPTPAPLAAQAPTVAQVRGTVFDSVAMTPLRGALVRIVRADDPSVGRSAQTDSLGAFVHDSVPTGVWLASFLHPVLDSLRLEPGIVRLEIIEAGVLQLPLGTPSGPTLVVQACGPGGADDAGVIFGTVRNADDETPLIGATVEVEWPEWTLAKKAMVTVRAQRRTVTDSLGAYRLCGVPPGSTLRARSWKDADSAGVVEVTVPASGYAVQDFDIERLARHFGISKAAARVKFTYRYQTKELDEQLLRHRKDHVFKSTCMFFDQKERRCTVYAARPSVCRMYPEDKTCGYYEFLKFERIQQGDEDFIPSA